MSSPFTLLGTDEEHPIQGISAVSSSTLLVTIQNRGAELWEVFDQRCVSSWSQDISTTWTTPAQPFGTHHFVGVLDNTCLCVWRENHNRVNKTKRQVKKPIFAVLLDKLLGEYMLVVSNDGAVAFFHRDLEKDPVRKFPPKALRLKHGDAVVWADTMHASNTASSGLYAFVLVLRSSGDLYLHVWEIPPLVSQPKRKRISTAKLMEGNTSARADGKLLNQTEWLGRWSLSAPTRDSIEHPQADEHHIVPLTICRDKDGLCVIWSNCVWERLPLPMEEFRALGGIPREKRTRPSEARGVIGTSSSFSYVLRGADGDSPSHGFPSSSSKGSASRGTVVPAAHRMLYPGRLASTSHGDVLALVSRGGASPQHALPSSGEHSPTHWIGLWDMRYGVQRDQQHVSSSTPTYQSLGIARASEDGDGDAVDAPPPLCADESIVNACSTGTAVCVATQHHVVVWPVTCGAPSLARAMGTLGTTPSPHTTPHLSLAHGMQVSPPMGTMVDLEALVVEHDDAASSGKHMRGDGVDDVDVFSRTPSNGLLSWGKRIGDAHTLIHPLLSAIEADVSDEAELVDALDRCLRLCSSTEDGKRHTLGHRDDDDDDDDEDDSNDDAMDSSSHDSSLWMTRHAFVGERVVVGVARACVRQGFWGALGKVVESRLVAHSSVPEMIPALVEHERLPLVVTCLKNMSDVDEATLVHLAQFFLTGLSDAAVQEFFANRGESASMTAYEGRLKLINLILWHESDPQLLRPWLVLLQASEVRALADQLLHWMEHYVHRSTLVSTDRNALLRTHMVVPSEAQVVAWLEELLQAHAAALVMGREYHPVVRELRMLVEGKLGWCRERAAFLGFVDQWERRLRDHLRRGRGRDGRGRLEAQMEVPEYAIEVLAL